MTYNINLDHSIGFSHSGQVMTSGSGTVDLTPDEVETLTILIKAKGTRNVYDLGIQKSHSAIWQKLYDACYNIAYKAEELYWLWEGYYEGAFDYDKEKLMAYCKNNCGYCPDKDENKNKDTNVNGVEDNECEEEELFDEWLNDYLYSLDDNDACKFFYKQMHADLCLDDIEVVVQLPDEING